METLSNIIYRRSVSVAFFRVIWQVKGTPSPATTPFRLIDTGSQVCELIIHPLNNFFVFGLYNFSAQTEFGCHFACRDGPFIME